MRQVERETLPSDTKRLYAAPALTVLGAVAQLTETGSAQSAEDNNINANCNPQHSNNIGGLC